MLPDNNKSLDSSKSNGKDKVGDGFEPVKILDPAEKECIEKLRKLGVDPAEPIVLDKDAVSLGAPFAGDKSFDILTNIYGLRTSSVPVYQYHCEFFKILQHGDRKGEQFPLVDTKGRKLPDFHIQKNRENHLKLMSKFFQKYPDVFGGNLDNCCFDYAHTLFSLTELTVPDGPLKLTVEETQATIDRPFAIDLHVKKFANNVFNIRDFVGMYSTDLSEFNSGVTRFLELATSHYVSEHPEEHVMFSNNQTNYMNPQNYGFAGVRDLNNGKYLCPGASKTVVCVDGPKKNGAAAIIVDSKKTPFYHAMNCGDMVMSALRNVNASLTDRQVETLQAYFRGMVARPTYGNMQRIPITIWKLTNAKENALTTKFNTENGEVSVNDYFQAKYNVTLTAPEWPLAIRKVGKENHYFPLEVLTIEDNQRCNRNITPEDIAVIVKECAVPPAVKSREVQNCHGSFQFATDNFCRNAQLNVMPEPLKLQARLIAAPKIEYANGDVSAEGGKWRLPRPARYVKTISCKKWGAVLLRYRDDRLGMQEFTQFVKRYLQECRNRGMEMLDPLNVWEVNGEDEQAVQNIFVDAHRFDVEFVLFGHPEKEKFLHPVIKNCERDFEVITQCIKTKTISNVLQKSPLSLENIVAKTNVKLGGLNYNFSIPSFKIDPSVLFIGLGMNHPGGGLGGAVNGKESVSVLGFAANDGENPNEFIGNFFYQPAFRDEKLSVLDEVVDEVLNRFKVNRGMVPSRIVFYRSGCSEGQFQAVLRYEIPLLTKVVSKHCPAPVTVIVPSKMHPVRFFKTNINPRDRANDQNIPPGTVIDNTAVHHVFTEFYLNSHIALQGSAKTPRYTVLFSSEPKPVDLDLFIRWTNALCYNFQIVTSPTSIPAPVYVALRYAERGRQIYNVAPARNGNGSNGNGGNGNGHHTNGNGNGNGHTNGNGNGNGHGNGSDTSHKSEYYLRSIHHNFSNQEKLRGKRVNA